MENPYSFLEEQLAILVTDAWVASWLEEEHDPRLLADLDLLKFEAISQGIPIIDALKRSAREKVLTWAQDVIAVASGSEFWGRNPYNDANLRDAPETDVRAIGRVLKGLADSLPASTDPPAL